MTQDRHFDYIPNQPFPNTDKDTGEVQHKNFQKQKWQVLMGSFLLILITANVVIWGQPLTYQTQSILHFSYASQTDLEYGELAQRQIALHKQRLKSNNILNLVVDELERSHRLVVNTQSLFDALSAQASITGRIITLKATGQEPQTLKPILEAWVKVYLELVISETQLNKNDELLVADQQLQLLELKITDQKQRLQLFAGENNITSLERDENRALSQTKNLGVNLDQALAEQTQAKVLHDSLIEFIGSGQTIIRPVDKSQIDAIKISLQDMKISLSALSEKYTQAYLERDPDIVIQQKKAQQLQILLEEKIKTSQSDYLLNVKRNLITAKGKADQMKIQLMEQNKLAQTFNQNLEQYKRIDEELKALQIQSQRLKNQQVIKEVIKPFEPKISLLEPAYIPDFPVGPNYQFQSLISLVIAIVASILSMLLFSFIFKQKATVATSNFMMMPGQIAANNYSNIGFSLHKQFDASYPAISSEPPKLPPLPQALRLLSLKECQLLFSVANNQGKVLVGLILSGVSIDELLAVNKKSVSENHSILNINSSFPRNINIQKELAIALQSICHSLADEGTIWTNIKNHQEFVQLLVNTGHDARIAFPEQLSLHVLRHTYLTYLVSQGARLNDIEQVAGYTSPSDLALYRNVNQQGKLFELKHIKTQYPFIVTG